MIGTLPPVLLNEDDEQTVVDVDNFAEVYYDTQYDSEDDDVLIAEQYLDQL